MARVLVTGMSGTGKSTLLQELTRRGLETVDTDEDGWVQADGGWDVARMDALLARRLQLVVSGTVDNQGQFYDRFAHVVLLSVPAAVIVGRVRRRTTNPYGQSPEQLAEILGYLETVEPLLRSGATIELDGRRPTAELADVVEGLAREQETAGLGRTTGRRDG